MKSAHHELVSDADEGLPVPTISSLTSVDTPLAPGEMINRLIGVVSPWIDLCSPDPIVYQISRQVLELEVAFAAFCGIGNIILPSPRLHHGKLHGEGITQYAYAIQNALEIAKFMQFSILLPMMDEPVQDRGEDETNLSGRARGKYMGLSEDHGHQRTSIEESMEDENGANLSRPRKKPVKVDFFGTWDAWNIIRTLCKYHTRLLVGKNGSASF